MSPQYQLKDVFSPQAIADEESLIASIHPYRADMPPEKRNSASRLTTFDREDDAAATQDVWVPLVYPTGPPPASSRILKLHDALLKIVPESLLHARTLYKRDSGAPDQGVDIVVTTEEGVFAADIKSRLVTEPEKAPTPAIESNPSPGDSQNVADSTSHQNDPEANPDLTKRLLEALECSTTDFRTVESLARELDENEQTIRRALIGLGDKIARRPLGQQSRYPNWWRLTAKGPTRGERRGRLKAVISFTRMDDDF